MSFNTATAYKASITIEFGQLQTMVDWCERNCVSEFWYSGEYERWEGDKMFYGYDFYFDSEKDYFAFVIWKK